MKNCIKMSKNIDPPYNTGARDWKYNNDYVDSSDSYRHSKWLSMMEKRLKLAKRLLNPSTGVLICAIDEHEVHHLRCLLEEIFSDFYIQMITCVTNPTGATQGRFSRIEEYLIYCFANDAYVQSSKDPMIGQIQETKSVRWKSLLRSGTSAQREDRPNMFYPVYIDTQKNVVAGVGNSLPLGEEPSFDTVNGYVVSWPIRTDGSYGRWSVGAETLGNLIDKGYVKLGRYDSQRRTFAITYVSSETQKLIEEGTIIIKGKNKDTGVVEIEFSEEKNQAIRTVWYRTKHNAGVYGTNILSELLAKTRSFPFPKSIYAVKDSISAVMKNRKDALIVDFFAGSGTTLHAVNLLNAEDGGQRRCIMVTNNEVSDSEAKSLAKQGYQPGDEEWERLGIARYVTWPRTVCSIEGHDINGEPLTGKYLDSDLAMADGFQTNAIYFKLGFLDKTAVALGRQFKELLSVLWMKAGSIGMCPQIEGETIPKMLILPDNRFAVLTDERDFPKFLQQIKKTPEIETVFIVTDSEPGYREMAAKLQVKTSYQLYRDYLDNFRINTGRK
jgi:adenine-specific DNA-methyltransferase